jgi:hypothetical protein
MTPAALHAARSSAQRFTIGMSSGTSKYVAIRRSASRLRLFPPAAVDVTVAALGHRDDADREDRVVESIARVRRPPSPRRPMTLECATEAL